MQRLCGGGLRSYLGNGSGADIAGGKSRLHAVVKTAAPCAVMRWVMIEKSAEVIVPEARIRGMKDSRLNNETCKLDLGRTEPVR